MRPVSDLVYRCASIACLNFRGQKEGFFIVDLFGSWNLVKKTQFQDLAAIGKESDLRGVPRGLD